MKVFSFSAASLLFAAAATNATFVYNPSEWPPINGDVLTGNGAPAPAGNASLTAEVGFVPPAGLPAVIPTSQNPQTGGVCPTTGNFGTNGSCWWTCGYGADGYPCAGPKDVRLCQPGKWGLTYDDGMSICPN